jgi:hypothetical protein
LSENNPRVQGRVASGCAHASACGDLAGAPARPARRAAGVRTCAAGCCPRAARFRRAPHCCARACSPPQKTPPGAAARQKSSCTARSTFEATAVRCAARQAWRQSASAPRAGCSHPAGAGARARDRQPVGPRADGWLRGAILAARAFGGGGGTVAAAWHAHATQAETRRAPPRDASAALAPARASCRTRAASPL